MKKIICFILIVLLAAAVLATWQPGFLKRAVIHFAQGKLMETAGLSLQVSGVKGNVFDRVVFQDVKVSDTKTTVPLLEAEEVAVDLGWLALWKHRILLQELTLRGLKLHVIVDENKKIVLPAWKRRENASPSPWRLETPLVVLQKGTLEITNRSMDPPGELILENVGFKARKGSSGWRVEGFAAGLSGGAIEGEGVFRPGNERSVEAEFKTRDFPFDQALRAAVPLPEPLRLSSSGSWNLQRSSENWTFSSRGTMDHSPFELQAEVKGAGDPRYRAHLEWENLSPEALWSEGSFPAAKAVSCRLDVSGRDFQLSDLNAIGRLSAVPGKDGTWPGLSADLNIREGKGSVRLESAFPGVAAQAEGVCDLAQRSLDLNYEIRVSSLNALSGFFPQAQDMNGQARVQGRVNGRLERLSLEGTLDVANASWKTRTLDSAQIRFHSQDNLKTYQVSLDVALTKKSHWSSTRPALVGFDSKRSFIHNLALTSDGQTLEGDANWTGQPQIQGDVRLLLKGGSLRGQPIDQAELQALVAQPWITVERLSLVSRGQEITAHGRVPYPSAVKRPFHLTVSAPELDPAVLTAFFSGVEMSAGGRSSIEADISGLWPHLTIDGSFTGSVPTLKVPALGLTLSDFRADVQSSGGVLRVREFQGRTKKGQLSLTGESRLPSLDFKLTGNRVPLKIGLSFEMDCAPDLSIKGSLYSPEITGDLGLREGLYRPLTKKKKKKSPSTQSANAAGPGLWRDTSVDLSVHWRRRVWYRDDLTGIETKGDLRIQKDRHTDQLSLVGVVESIRGSYVYYGRNFVIERGALTFLGSDPASALLDVQAIFKSEPVIVTLLVTGTVRDPQIALSSNPPLSEQDVLSVLVFGRPLSELRAKPGEKSAADQEVAQAAGEVLGGYLTQSLYGRGLEKLDLDVVSIQPATDGTKITVGRYVGPNLFVSYGQTVGTAASRRVTTEYTITRDLSVKAETGTLEASFVDLLFRYPLNASTTTQEALPHGKR